MPEERTDTMTREESVLRRMAMANGPMSYTQWAVKEIDRLRAERDVACRRLSLFTWRGSLSMPVEFHVARGREMAGVTSPTLLPPSERVERALERREDAVRAAAIEGVADETER